MKDWKRAPGIMVYDASTDQELMEFGKFLMKKGELTVMAAAPVLPEFYHLCWDWKAKCRDRWLWAKNSL